MNDEPADSSAHPPRPPRGVGGTRLPPLDWAVAAGATEELWRETQGKVRRRRQLRRRWVTGGLAAALIVGALGWIRAGWRPGAADGAGGETVAVRSTVLVPEQRVLADGSKIELKPGAAVSISYSDTIRAIVLLRGEAHFQVTKDARRPFVVRAGGLEVRAVGTAFSVQLETRQIDVLVTEGRVAVERAPAGARDSAGSAAAPVPPSALALVEAGRRVVVACDARAETAPPVVAPVSHGEIAERLAWRAPRLDFTRTPLAEALPLINRHSRVQVRLGDPSLGSVRLSGILRADNLETLLRLLESEHGLRAEWPGPDEVVLHRAP